MDDADVENGCMRMLPKTHTLELHEMVPSKDTDTPNVLGSGIDPDVRKQAIPRLLVISWAERLPVFSGALNAAY